jgi:hypothetical protein
MTRWCILIEVFWDFLLERNHATQHNIARSLFVDQEVGGSIPPNRTNLFNDLTDFVM